MQQRSGEQKEGRAVVVVVDGNRSRKRCKGMSRRRYGDVVTIWPQVTRRGVTPHHGHHCLVLHHIH